MIKCHKRLYNHNNDNNTYNYYYNYEILTCFVIFSAPKNVIHLKILVVPTLSYKLEVPAQF